MKRLCRLNVNGEDHELAIENWETLSFVLREKLGLTGTKVGCEVGECGACTVLVDGRTMMACLLLAVELEAAEIQTIEGMAQDGELHPLQRSFVEKGATQCGFCTPGVLMSSKAVLDAKPDADLGEIKTALSGNHCRCTGYTKIIDAVLDAQSKLRSSK